MGSEEVWLQPHSPLGVAPPRIRRGGLPEQRAGVAKVVGDPQRRQRHPVRADAEEAAAEEAVEAAPVEEAAAEEAAVEEAAVEEGSEDEAPKEEA